jgi:hypothetical protein
MNIDDTIDDEWITEFNEEERSYGKFYKEPNAFISLQFIYINSKKEIEYVTQVKHQLDKENIITSTTLNKLISERNYVNNTNFRLYKLLLYNVTLEPEEIISDANIQTEFREITEIEDIAVEDTINYLKTLNTLVFIFVEDTSELIVLKEAAVPTFTISLNKGSRRNKRSL